MPERVTTTEILSNIVKDLAEQAANGEPGALEAYDTAVKALEIEIGSSDKTGSEETTSTDQST